MSQWEKTVLFGALILILGYVADNSVSLLFQVFCGMSIVLMFITIVVNLVDMLMKP